MAHDPTPTTATLARLPVATLSPDAAQVALGEIARTRSWLDGLEARVLSRLDDLADQGDGPGAREAALLDGGWSGHAAGRVTARAGVLRAVPALGAALEAGAATAEHVDALANGCRDLDERQRAELLDDPAIIDAATRMRPDPFTTHVRNRVRHIRATPPKPVVNRLERWVRGDGIHIVKAELDAATGAKVFAAIDAEIESLAQAQSLAKNETTAALALASLVDRGLGAGPNTTPAEVIVIDAATLADGPHDHTVCATESGAPLPPTTVGRIMCRAIVLPTVINRANGVVLQAGRTVRVANRAQRRALRAMYPTCAFPSCTVGFDHCQMHHITPWQNGGRTDMENLLPVCSRHHHLVHEGGWSLSLDRDRTQHVRQPDGRLFRSVAVPSAQLAAAIAVWPSAGQNRQSARPPDRPCDNRAA